MSYCGCFHFLISFVLAGLSNAFCLAVRDEVCTAHRNALYHEIKKIITTFMPDDRMGLYNTLDPLNKSNLFLYQFQVDNKDHHYQAQNQWTVLIDNDIRYLSKWLLYNDLHFCAHHSPKPSRPINTFHHFIFTACKWLYLHSSESQKMSTQQHKYFEHGIGVLDKALSLAQTRMPTLISISEAKDLDAFIHSNTQPTASNGPIHSNKRL